MFQSPGSIAFSIGPFSVHWYGILIGLGILLAYFYASAEFKRRKIDRKHLDDMVFWLVLAGILGARIYYVLFTSGYYFAHPLEALAIWKGGLAIHGALIGGALTFAIYVLKHKLKWTLYADAIAPGMLLAQAIGRWGNFFNSEAFGAPTQLPWKLFIPEQNRPAQYVDFSYFHPTFLYESLWNLLGFALLVWLARRGGRQAGEHRAGYVFFTYFIWYSVGRFFIESLRTDSLYMGQFRAAQIASVLLFSLGLAGLIILRKKSRL